MFTHTRKSPFLRGFRGHKLPSKLPKVNSEGISSVYILIGGNAICFEQKRPLPTLENKRSSSSSFSALPETQSQITCNMRGIEPRTGLWGCAHPSSVFNPSSRISCIQEDRTGRTGPKGYLHGTEQTKTIRYVSHDPSSMTPGKANQTQVRSPS